MLSPREPGTRGHVVSGSAPVPAGISGSAPAMVGTLATANTERAPGRHARSRDGGPERLRGDIEGLRAIAVILVLLFHAGLPFVKGGFIGVDVFLVISGFLITSLLVDEADRRGTISLAGFYARRAKRLLPAVAVVLVATAGLVYAFVPQTRWRDIGGDIVASALYVVNWRFAARSVDYLAQGSSPSPVQHFWSLAVEEQYYLVWPLVILVTLLIARLLRRRPRTAIGIGLAVIVVPSLAWSAVETAHSPAEAFFETTTRMWELGIGGAVALGAALWPRLPRALAMVVGWAGLAAVIASGVLFSTQSSWPGYSAALPVVGTAAVIAAGFAVGGGPGPAGLLGTRPMRWLGGLSYSLYLWHWPLIVVAAAIWGDLSPAVGLLVAALSVIPAWLSYRLVENPFRHSRTVSASPRLALSFGANFSFVGVTAGLAILVALGVAANAAIPQGIALGARVLRASPRDDPAGAPVDEVAWMTPLPTQATSDVPEAFNRGCQQVVTKSDVVTCDYGDVSGHIVVAVVGDSKMMQWMPALDPIAKQNGWHLVLYMKSSCGFAQVTVLHDGTPYDSCRAWMSAVSQRLAANRPDYLMTTQGESTGIDASGKATNDAMVAGLRAAWSPLTAQGVKVVVILDNLAPGMEVYECVEKNLHHLTACAFSRTKNGAGPVQQKAAQGQNGVSIVNLNDAICPTAQCAPVIGNVLIYRQGTHITATYIQTLTPRLASALSDAGLYATYEPGAR